MSVIKDFKAFAFKGNVIDLAVAVVIGAAFTKIVSAIVDGIIMPLLGKALPGGSYEAWAPGGVRLGLVIAAAIDFLAIAAVLFVIVSMINRAMKKPLPPEEKPAPSAEVVLLTEIRDQLARR
ncbi:MAG TPA: large conductance mechanosensitive channel protein MscL [Kofleriaceae bacterium]|jgi:large conductance mechanosensitive channel|nr:large conductance mechanosensitive channel protein MscL [Kofleriaceae bacterium]